MNAILGFLGAQLLPSQTFQPANPISTSERLKWLATSTVGPASLAGGVVVSGFGTWRDSPVEYDTHWTGFGKRYGLRMSGVATSNVMEASLGALWREDPRYPRMGGRHIGKRAWYCVRSALVAYDASGNAKPAYARYTAVAGSNLISTSWRPDSEKTAANITLRIGYGFLARMAANAVVEFLPDIRSRKLRD